VAGSRQSLSRTVTVRVFTPGSGHVPRVMEDARAACWISDSRLGQIFDADDRAEPLFIVTNGHTAPTLPTCSVTARSTPATRPA